MSANIATSQIHKHHVYFPHVQRSLLDDRFRTPNGPPLNFGEIILHVDCRLFAEQAVSSRAAQLRPKATPGPFVPPRQRVDPKMICGWLVSLLRVG
jgi:hypothetical protein